MVEHRAASRHPVNERALITVDEHTSIACLIHDQSDFGTRLTVPDASAVPDAFLLDAPSFDAVHICRVAWRTDEMIGAWFDLAANW